MVPVVDEAMDGGDEGWVSSRTAAADALPMMIVNNISMLNQDSETGVNMTRSTPCSRIGDGRF